MTNIFCFCLIRRWIIRKRKQTFRENSKANEAEHVKGVECGPSLLTSELPLYNYRPQWEDTHQAGTMLQSLQHEPKKQPLSPVFPVEQQFQNQRTEARVPSCPFCPQTKPHCSESLWSGSPISLAFAAVNCHLKWTGCLDLTTNSR